MLPEDPSAWLRQDDHAALSRAITLVENGGSGSEALLAVVRTRLGRAHRVGITGPPGAGKSTLVQGLVRVWRAEGRTVGVVAVDPTSPRTGGALLGDRIRMERVSLDPGVFIRSMATRGAHGGLARTTREVCDVLDAAGFDLVVVETVGVGQNEVEVARATDTTVLVLVPESGDGIQALKAGLMEVADLFVVNKADRPGADGMVRDVEAGRRAGGQAGEESSWEPPVLATVATEDRGIAEVAAAIGGHKAWLTRSGLLAERRSRPAPSG
jgi:LAO/AO transport system kinase